MAKVLLLNPPGERLYLRDQHCSSESKASYYWPPIDLLIQSGILSEEHEVHFLDATIEGLPSEEALSRIQALKPAVILFVTGIASWLGDFGFMEKAHNITGAEVFASGGFLRSDYREVMGKYPFLTGVLLDYTSYSLLAYLKGERQLTDLSIRLNGEIVCEESDTPKRFSIPVPRHELFPLAKYRLPHGRHHPFTCILTNYGCPYRCSYCVAQDIDFKQRTVENILEEVDKIVSLGIREIFFKDFTFGVSKEITKNLCQEMIHHYPGLSWVCSSRVNVVDEEMLVLMKKAGCHTIQFGVESGSQELLDQNCKMVTLAQIEETFILCHKHRIRTLGHFILGLPGETEESLLQTIAFAKKIKCDYASFNVAIPIPGTALRRTCEDNNWLVGDDEELDSSRGYPVIETPFLSRKRLWQLQKKAVRSFYLRPSFILNKLADVRSFHDMLTLFREGIALLGNLN